MKKQNIGRFEWIDAAMDALCVCGIAVACAVIVVVSGVPGLTA